jgi:hypothetical protein
MALHPIPAALKLCFETIHLPDDKMDLMQRLFEEYGYGDHDNDIYEYHRDLIIKFVHCGRQILKEGQCDARTLFNEIVIQDPHNPHYQSFLQCHEDYMQDLNEQLSLIPNTKNQKERESEIRYTVEKHNRNADLMRMRTIDQYESNELYQAANHADLHLKRSSQSIEYNPIIAALNISFSKILCPGLNIFDEVERAVKKYNIADQTSPLMDMLASCSYHLIDTLQVSARDMLLDTLHQKTSSVAWSSLTRTHKDHLANTEKKSIAQKNGQLISQHIFAHEKQLIKYAMNSVECLCIDDDFYEIYDLAIETDNFLKIRGPNGP